mmetsp:Transcript_112217/g.183048  ORF Transcript_112217/g.183048 Transcript_112217/m.183048 type:complete len:329 (-) Transcript_112217:106-1092(-)
MWLSAWPRATPGFARAVLRRNALQRSAVGSAVRGNTTLAGAMLAQDPQSLALVAPLQQIRWTYSDLSARVGRIAGEMARLGYKAGDIVATDLASVPENLLLQLSASHLGAAVLTSKGAQNLKQLRQELNVRGACMSGGDSFLAGEEFPLQSISVEPLPGMLTLRDIYENELGVTPAPVAGDSPLGYYANTKPITNAAALEQGAAAKAQLSMGPKDVVLVSITLNHLFGIGSAVSGALLSGAAVVLPDASGVVGCGSPGQRAQVTFECLNSQGCTIFFADTHTLKALPSTESGSLPSLRGGVCKTGSGTTFLDQTVEYAGVQLTTIGKA